MSKKTKEFKINPKTKNIYVSGGQSNMSGDITVSDLYSFLQDEWVDKEKIKNRDKIISDILGEESEYKDEDDFIKYPFPFIKSENKEFNHKKTLIGTASWVI